MLREPWRAEVLGNSTLRCGREAVNSVRDRLLMALVTMLALQPDRSLTRQQIMENLWPDEDPAITSNRLRVLLHRLRGLLEPLGVETGSVLIARRHAVALNPSGFSCDAADFISALDLAQHAQEPADRIPHLERAIALYKGELLPGLYHDWVLAERDRLAAVHFQAVRRLTHDLTSIGDTERAIPFARMATSLDSMDEEAHFDLIRALGTGGWTTEALRHYDKWRSLLHKELGSEPAPATRSLARLLQQRLGHSAGSSEPATLGAEGDRASRLDLPDRDAAATRPSSETIGAGDIRPDLPERPTAPNGCAEPAAPRRSILPPRLTRFFGRDEEIEILWSLLSPASPARLVTLLGPAGAGKTRLSLETAERLQEAYSGRVFFVGLADVSSATQIPDALLHALRLPPSPGQEPFTQARAALGETPALLLLDNMEQLLPDAKDLVAELVRQTPALRCLMTSRRAAGVEGEWIYPLAPLPLPGLDAPPDDLAAYPAVALFVDRARAARVDFALTKGNASEIVSLCRRLEGLPLALELAAARVRVLSVREMNDQIGTGLDWLVDVRGGKEVRHRSLRSAIEWSYRLMSASARRDFHAMSVFVGGFSAAAAAALCDPPVSNSTEALAMLDSLCSDSLIFTREGASSSTRFVMLESIRAFGLEQLASSGRADAVRLSHLRWFTNFAEATFSESSGALRARGDEDANMRAALEFGLREGAGPEEWELAARLARSLPDHFIARGTLAEGRRVLERILLLPVDDRIKAKARLGAAKLAIYQGQFAEGSRLAGEGLDVAELSGDDSDRAESLLNLGTSAFRLGDYGQAAAHLEAALARMAALQDRKLQAACLVNLGMVHWYQADHAAARGRLEEARTIYEGLGSQRGMADCLLKLGNVVRDTGDLAGGEVLMNQALDAFQDLGDRHGISTALHDLGLIARFSGSFALAESRFVRSREQFQETGVVQGAASCTQNLAVIAIGHGQLEKGRLLLFEALETYRRMGARRALAECMIELSRVCETTGDLEEARDLASQALAIDRELQNRQGIANDLERLGLILLTKGDPHNARETLNQALLLVEKIGSHAATAAALEARIAFAAAMDCPRDAVRLAGKSAAVFGSQRTVRPPDIQHALDRLLDSIRRKIGQNAFDAAWTEGQTLSTSDAFRLALSL